MAERARRREIRAKKAAKGRYKTKYPKVRKSPIRHKVKRHTRNDGTKVQEYFRGEGVAPPRKPIVVKPRSVGAPAHPLVRAGYTLHAERKTLKAAKRVARPLKRKHDVEIRENPIGGYWIYKRVKGVTRADLHEFTREPSILPHTRMFMRYGKLRKFHSDGFIYKTKRDADMAAEMLKTKQLTNIYTATRVRSVEGKNRRIRGYLVYVRYAGYNE